MLAYSQSCHFRLATLGIEPLAATVDLRMVPKKSPKTCTKRLSYFRLCRLSKHAKQLRFLSRCIRRHVVRAGLGNTAATVSLGRAAAERRSMFYTSAAGLNQISFFKSRYSKESQGNWYEYVRAIFSTAAKHLLGSSRSPRWFKWLTSNSTRV